MVYDAITISIYGDNREMKKRLTSTNAPKPNEELKINKKKETKR